MTGVFRRCTVCGHIEPQVHWHSIGEAARQGALQADWACAVCAWPEAELVEVGGPAAAKADEPDAAIPDLPRP